MPDEQPVESALRRVPRQGFSQAGLTKEQKIGFGLLLVFAILTVGLGVLQIRNTLYAPFALTNTVPLVLKDSVVNNIDALRFRDTDIDELSDFDELYLYGTSPYLYDTFGYGISDKEVIAKGLPLCPKGQDCAGAVNSGVGVPTESATSTVAVITPSPGEAPPDLIKMLRDPATVRQMLLDGGTDKKILDKISDAELMSLAGQVLSSSSTLQSLRAINGIIPTTTQR